jgi:hypothetical protein
MMNRIDSFKSTALRSVLAALVAAGLALGVAQGEPATPGAQPGMGMQQDVTLPPGVDPQEPVAQIGMDEPLTQQQFAQEFDRAMRGFAMQHGLQFTDEFRTMFERFRGEFLQMWATQQALLREADVRGIEIADVEVDQQLTEARGLWGADFDRMIGDLGYQDELAYREAIREGLLAQRVVDDLRAEFMWTDQDLEQFHTEHRDRFFGGQEFADVRDQVEQRWMSEQLQGRFADLRVQYGIEVFPDRLVGTGGQPGLGN